MDPPGDGPAERLLNPFLNHLLRNSEPSASSNRNFIQQIRLNAANLIILVPATAPLLLCDDERSKKPYSRLCKNEEFVLSHIIKIPPLPVGGVKNRSGRSFSTLNGKQLAVNGDTIYDISGFRYSVSARILHETLLTPQTTYFTRNTKLMILFISRPLVGKPIPRAEPEFPGVPLDILFSSRDLNLMDEQRTYHRSDLQTDQSSIPPDDPLARHNSVPPLGEVLSRFPLMSQQIGARFSRLFKSFSCKSAASEAQLLNSFHQTMAEAAAIFQSLDQTFLADLLAATGFSRTDLERSLHIYVENSIADKLWRRLAELQAASLPEEPHSYFSDLELRKLLSNISIGQVGLPHFSPEQLGQLEVRCAAAVKQLELISSATNSDGKLRALLRTLDLLTCDRPESHQDSQPEPHIAGVGSLDADTLVGLLLFVVLRSSDSQLQLQLAYLRLFAFDSVDIGQAGYGCSTLEAVLFYLADPANTARLAETCRQNLSLWAVIAEDDAVDLQQFLPLPDSSPPPQESPLYARNRAGDSAVLSAIQLGSKSVLQSLLARTDVFPWQRLLADRNTVSGTALLSCVVQTGDSELADIILDALDAAPPEAVAAHLAIRDTHRRTAGHYLFASRELLYELGLQVAWDAKDCHGQTPLFALCRSYDHPAYPELVRDAFAICDAWYREVRGMSGLCVHDHIDARGNTLLHILVTAGGVKAAVRHGAAVNAANQRGVTPLMVYAKYARIEALRALCATHEVDFLQRDCRGITALELAKSGPVQEVLDELFLFAAVPVVDGRMLAGVVRPVWVNGQLQIVVKSGVVASSGAEPEVDNSPYNSGFYRHFAARREKQPLFSVSRTVGEFQFLWRWLRYENPHSWLPSLDEALGYEDSIRKFQNATPKSDSGLVPLGLPFRFSRRRMQDLAGSLNSFLWLLLSHPQFGSHELLWEFLAVQELDYASCVARCKRKLENSEEKYRNYTASTRIDGNHKLEVLQNGFGVLTGEEMYEIAMFARHFTASTAELSRVLKSLVVSAERYKLKTADVAEAQDILWQVAQHCSFGKPPQLTRVFSILRRECMPWAQITGIDVLYKMLMELDVTVDTVMLKVGRMNELLQGYQQVVQQEDRTRQSLARLQTDEVGGSAESSAAGTAGADSKGINVKKLNFLTMSESKRKKTEAKLTQEIQQLQYIKNKQSAAIRAVHETVATEVGEFFRIKSLYIRDMIAKKTLADIRVAKTRMASLQSVLNTLKHTEV